MSEESIYKVDTVPPPGDEGDAYNAPTRVGAMPPMQVLEAMREAAATSSPMKPVTLPHGSRSVAPAAEPAQTPPARPVGAIVSVASAPSGALGASARADAKAPLLLGISPLMLVLGIALVALLSSAFTLLVR